MLGPSPVSGTLSRRVRRAAPRVRACSCAAPKPGDQTQRDRPRRTSVPERLACKHVGEVHLHHGHRGRRERVAQRHARVRESARVDQDAVGPADRGVDAVDQHALVVALEALHLGAALLGRRSERRVDLLERGGAVDLGLARAEHVEVGAVDHLDPAQLAATRGPPATLAARFGLLRAPGGSRADAGG